MTDMGVNAEKRGLGCWLLVAAALAPWGILLILDYQYGSMPAAAPLLTLIVGGLGVCEGALMVASAILVFVRRNRLFLAPAALALLSMLCFLGMFFHVLQGGLP